MARRWLGGAVMVVVVALAVVTGAARRNWAYIRLAHGDTAGWRDATAPLAAGSRSNDLALLRRSVESGDWGTVQRILAVHGADPDRLASLIVLDDAEERVRRGDPAGAHAALATVRSTTSHDAGLWYRIGAVSEAARQDHEAVDAYARGEQFDAASPWAEGRYHIAIIYQRDAEWQRLVDLLAPQFEAASDANFEQPIQASEPGAVWQGTFLALADAYEHLGRAAKAEAVYERLASIQAPRRDWTLNRALVYLCRAKRTNGEFVTALDAIVRALNLSTTFETSYRERFELDTAAEAEALVDDVRRANVLAVVQSAVDDETSRNPESAGAWFVRGLMREAACDRDGARAAYIEAARVAPTGAGAFLKGRPSDPPKAPCPPK